MGLPALESNGRSQDTEALYREHQAAVARLCRSLLRDRAEAEDATQQVFLAAHRALLNGSVPREPLAWLLAVARHECYARFRQRTTTPVPTGDTPDGSTPDASAQVLSAGQLATVWEEVGQMPRAQREAFLLREIRGLSYGQLAEELSLSKPSVRSLLLRARARLRHRLRDVAAGLGGAPWVQSLVRLVSGDGASPVPAATKAAAVGLGALALVGGGGDLAQTRHHLSKTPGHAGPRHQAHARARRPAMPTATAVVTGRDVRHSTLEQSQTRDGGSRESSSGSGHLGTSSGDGSSGSGRDGSDDATAVVQPTTSGSSDGSGGTSTTSGSSGHGSSDGGSSGSSSGPGGGSDSTTTTTTTTTSSGSDGSGSSGGDGGGGSSGHG
jgi:RNA polymerase sigma factor (sigma-70 family)